MTVREIMKIKNIEVAFQSFNEDDYISLTDMAKFKDSVMTGIVIANWLSTKYTIQFIGAWEQIHNSIFNVMEFHNIKNEAGSNGFILSSSKWIQKTNAIGIKSSTGRYGGTFAHKDIAFEFATWLSPEFKLYLIKEFERLKSAEYIGEKLEWNARRMISKTNYRIHTDAIKEKLPKYLTDKQINIIYATEADVLNVALFGKTAGGWKKDNKGKKGNMRDNANILELIVLSNPESYNAELVRQRLPQSERLKILNQSAINQMKSLIGNTNIKLLEKEK